MILPNLILVIKKHLEKLPSLYLETAVLFSGIIHLI